jgi:hypothetical protein
MHVTSYLTSCKTAEEETRGIVRYGIVTGNVRSLSSRRVVFILDYFGGRKSPQDMYKH